MCGAVWRRRRQTKHALNLSYGVIIIFANAPARTPVAEATRPVRFPVWDRPGVAPGFIPKEGTGVRVCVRVYRCVVCVRV